jgi:putative aminopeptidase FrvX
MSDPPAGTSETPELLDALLRAPAPSGYEGPAAAIWREAAEFAELSWDALGSSVARVAGRAEGAATLAIVGHIDEIGLVVTHVDEQGFLWFGPIGGWDPQNLVGQRVLVAGREGPVPGVLGKKPIHLLKDEARKQPAKIEEMHIDIGAADREEAERLVRVGDPAVLAAEPLPLPNGRLVSRSLDNRLGSYVALEVARRCAERGVGATVAGVAAVQEEITLGGSRTTAFSLDPDLAIVVDVTHATDAPGIDKKENGDHALGSGPVIGRGSTLSPRIGELLIEAAEAEGIEHTLEASGRHTGTDADAIQIARAGIPTGLVSIPLRYMHSTVEMVQLSDVEGVVRLLVAFSERLGPGLDLRR